MQHNRRQSAMISLSVDEALKLAVEAHKAGDLHKADQFYTAILKFQPRHPDANHNLGVVAVQIGQIKKAMPFFEIALEVNPNIEQFWISYIDALIKLERNAEAKSALYKAKSMCVNSYVFEALNLKLYKSQDYAKCDDSTANVNSDKFNILDRLKLDQALKLASKKIKDGMINDGLEIYRDILERFPNNKRAKSELKSIKGKTKGGDQKFNEPSQHELKSLLELLNSKNFNEANLIVNSLIKKFPKSAILYNIQGAVLASLDQFEKSVVAYKKSILINRFYPDAYNNLGNLLKDYGKLDEAIEVYKKALEINSNLPDIYNNLGNALKIKGNLNEAINCYQMAIKIKPNFAQAYNNLGNAYKKNDQLLEAIIAYEKSLEISPDLSEPYNNLGTALKEQGKFEEAFDAYQKAIELKPDYYEAYNNLGILLNELDRLDDAMVAYEKVIAIKPDYAVAYNNLGVVLSKQGKLTERLAAYKKAIQIKPDYAEAYNNLANTLKEIGKFDESREAYRKVLEIDPSHNTAKHMFLSLSGETPKKTPYGYVENLFDAYAKKFEKSLVIDLEYKIPKVVKNILLGEFHLISMGAVLDLGCGTGLLGPEIKSICSDLVGVDISQEMLNLASTKGVYNSLFKSGIEEFLEKAQLNFDYYIALDVFIYIGDLSDIFRLLFDRSKKPGKLVFSTEHLDEGEFQLNQSGRFSHSKSYIENLCEQYNFTIAKFSKINLRKERNRYIEGAIYIIDF